MKRKIFISAGHSNVPGKDMGADGLDGVKEGNLTVELRNLVIKEFKLLGENVTTDVDSNVTKETVILINGLLSERDIALDIHFNAFARESANGTEVIVPFKSSQFERELAAKLSKEVAICLGNKDRGYITEAQSARGTLIFMRPNCENILLEVCFITNRKDLDSYLSKKNEVAKVIAKTLYEYVTK